MGLKWRIFTWQASCSKVDNGFFLFFLIQEKNKIKISKLKKKKKVDNVIHWINLYPGTRGLVH